MTRSEIRTLILGWVDDPSGGYFDSTTVNTWINLAQRHVQGELLQAGQNWYEKPVETLTVSGQADYVMPSDLRIIHRVEYVLSGTGTTEDRRAIKELTINQQDAVSIALGSPTNYVLKKNRITLSPTPDTSNKVLRIYYSPMATDMSSDSDSPDVPTEFHEYVAIVAAFNAYIKDDRVPNNILVKKQEYLDMLKRMADDRTQDGPRQVVVVTDYDSQGFI